MLFLKNKISLLFCCLAVLAITLPSYAVDSAPATQRDEKKYSPFPNPDSGYVTDIAGLLTPEEEERIERWLWQVESKRNVEIIVVTINSIKDYPGTPNSAIEPFATALFDKYGIGNMLSNDGVLLLIASQDRKARIELGAGYGHTRDNDAHRIIDKEIIARFKKGKFVEGITEGVRAIVLEFAGLRIGFPWHVVGIGFAIVVLGFISASLLRNGKRGWGWIIIGLMIVLLFVLIRMVTEILRHLPNTVSSGWGSGGIGGFGGGFSGGGGASGGW